MDIGWVVPLVRHFTSHRHATTENGPTMRPVPEIGKGDNAVLRHARHFLENALRVVHGLQRPGEHYGMELLVVKESQTFFQILLYYPNTAAHAGDYLLIAQLNSRANALLFVLQMCQQGAVTTSKIKHPAARVY